MLRIVRPSLALLLVASVVACGDSSGSSSGKTAPSSGGAAGTPAAASAPTNVVEPAVADAVKARLLAFFEVAKAGGGAKAAEFIVYKGADPTRQYKSAATYEGDEQKQVDRAVKKVRTHLDLGAPNFVSAEAKMKGAEKWVAWKVRYGEGAAAKHALYAFIDAGGTWLLGDIDEIRDPSKPK